MNTRATAVKRKLKKQKHAVPYHYKPNDMDFEKWQMELRRQYAREQPFKMVNRGNHPFYSNFELYNPKSNSTYKVAIRSVESGNNFCTCMDFRVNSLGTCKHIEYVLYKLMKNRQARLASKENIVPDYSSLALRYGRERKVVLRIGAEHEKKMQAVARPYFDENMTLKESAFQEIDSFIEKARKINPGFKCYPDALEFIIEQREKQQRTNLIDAKYRPINKPDNINNLLKLDLFPYQQEAVFKAAKAGRYIIADDMGLGKTLQAIAVAQLMQREFKIERTLIICPTSLKYQWESEIQRFCDSSVRVIEGSYQARTLQLKEQHFFKIMSYHAAVKTLDEINAADFDLIILDEAQRIKNWQTQTAQRIKKLRSEHCLVLTGTPLENKLDELHSIVEYVDRFQLGLLARFLFKHRLLDEKGKLKGYKGLNEIATALQSVCIRRIRKEVLSQLPSRTDKIYFVEVTAEQKLQHEEHAEEVARLAAKWGRMHFLSEKERQRLLLSLSCMRMLADSTYILDQQSRHDTKVTEILVLLDEILQQPEEKVVVFTQWERMGRLIAQGMDALNIKYSFLHGGVPSNKRGELLHNFKTDENVKVFLSTDAGSTGLNLQNAAYLINVDLPWNPAVLEQRIARIYRLGQQKPVQIFNFVSKGTIEERMLSVLQFKKNLFEGVLDGGDDVVFMGESKLKQFMSIVEDITVMKPHPVTVSEPEVEWNNTETNTPQPDLQPSLLHNEIIEKDEAVSRKNSTPPASPDKDKIQKKEAAQQFLQDGLSFFARLNEFVNNEESRQALLNEIVEENKETGESYLKIKLSDKQLLSSALKALGSVAKTLQQ